jgi:hypothetical protein
VEQEELAQLKEKNAQKDKIIEQQAKKIKLLRAESKHALRSKDI